MRFTRSVLCATAFAVACGKPSAKPAGNAPSPISVVVATAAETTISDRLEAGGVVAAATSATIASRIAAPVMALRVRAGDRVRSGDVLVVLDDRDITARAREADALHSAAEQGLTAAKSELAAATAERKLATSWQQRIAQLEAKGSATAAQLDEANARLASAAARVEGAEARIAQASAQVGATGAAADATQTTRGFSVVRAPFDGIVTETMTEVGNFASTGTPLLRMDAAGGRRVEVTIDESRAPNLHVGDHVTVLFDGPPRRAIEAVVAEIGRAVASDRRAVIAKVTLPNGESPASGTFARIRFAGTTRRALTIPSAAMRREGQVATTLVVENDTARVRLVRAGEIDGDRAEILAGVDAGERVIVQPPPQVIDGTRVDARVSAAGGAP